jgi:hypothetical protein
MDTQTIIVIALIAAAALAMGWRAWRIWQGKRSGCGCDHCPAAKDRDHRQG